MLLRPVVLNIFEIRAVNYSKNLPSKEYGNAKHVLKFWNDPDGECYYGRM